MAHRDPAQRRRRGVTGVTLTVARADLSDGRTLDRFVRLPHRLMRRDPNWIPPLLLERKEGLSHARNPFFHHAETAFWLATRDGRDVGRISAQIDRLPREPVGHFGLLVAKDDAAVFAALTAAAEGWLRERGMTEAVGPFNLSSNEEVGLLVDGFDAPPMLLMGHDPPYAGSRLEAQGYAKAKDVHAYLADLTTGLPEPIRARLARGVPSGVTLRNPDMRRFEAEVRTIAAIVNDAWSGNWGFAPWTEAETVHLANSLRPLIDPRLVWFVDVDRETAGFIVVLPNLNEAIRDLGGRLLPFGWAKLLWRLKHRGVTTARVPLMGVRPAFAKRPGGAMLPFVLIDAAWRACRDSGYRHVELSWVLEDNRPMQHIIKAADASRYKTYRLYRKAL